MGAWVHRAGRNVFDSLTVDGIDVFRLDSHTNVWQIGTVIYCLIHRIPHPEQVQYYSNADFGEDAEPLRRRGRRRAPSVDMTKAPRREPWRPDIPAPGYSSTLIDLVHECLSMDPVKRPTLGRIRAVITPSMGLDLTESFLEECDELLRKLDSRGTTMIAAGSMNLR
ncbi:hypothetical protein LTR08_001592 [Meristemomyces frigidus]|nr:hypothetical protein LTR08_001592 [Meristemomyces frigidus]